MRLHRFYIQNENFETLNPGDIFMCKNNEVVRQVSLVLRAQVGDRILFFNETGEIEIMVQGFSKKELVCVMQKHTKPLIQKKRVYILQSLIKKDKFEWVAQKATEIGATDIIPVISERSEKRGIDQKRLQKIVIEATEQSGWGRVPILHNIDSLEKAIMRLKNDKVITFTLDMEGTKTFSKEQKSIAICIGPEGGWSKHDKEIFKKNNVKSINIGDSVLRAETAAIIATYTFINK
jgi:16S rRNA (uracil1498-N3)-methyltransferase